MLDGLLPILGLAVGDSAVMLDGLPLPWSIDPVALLTTAGAPGLAAAGLAGAFGLGSCRMRATPMFRKNMPWPGLQSKYRSPWTEPSFLPVASSNSTPTQRPSAKEVSPMKRITPTRPSLSSTTWPAFRLRSPIVDAVRVDVSETASVVDASSVASRRKLRAVHLTTDVDLPVQSRHVAGAGGAREIRRRCRWIIVAVKAAVAWPGEVRRGRWSCCG